MRPASSKLAFHTMICILASIFPSLPSQGLASEAINLADPAIYNKIHPNKMFIYKGSKNPDEVTASKNTQLFRRALYGEKNDLNDDDFFWYRMALENPSDTPIKTYFYHPFNSHPIFRVYQDRKLVANLTKKSQLDRIVELEIPPRSKSYIYINFQSNLDTSRVNWKLFQSMDELYDLISDGRESIIVLLSIYSMSILFTLMLYLAYKKFEYLLYCIYLLTMIANTIWFDSFTYIDFLAKYGLAISLLSPIPIFLFLSEFLEIKAKSPIIYRALLASCFLLLSSTLAYQGSKYTYFISVSQGIVVLAIIGFIFYSLRRYLRLRETHVAITLVSFGSLGVLSTIQFLEWFGFLKLGYNDLISYGVAIENLIMLVAMGHKINSTEKERLRSYSQLQHAYMEFKKIIYPHQLDAIQKGFPIEQTMPISSDKAVVISFDIQKSTKLGYNKHHVFFEEVLKRCHDLITEKYDPVTLASRAYMVKEMGDGFICSVGFPFTNNNSSIADEALHLAEQFIDAVETIADRHFTDQSIHCGIGIATGSITGYFPKTGLKQYDLYGEAIVKATRYEAMRKVILNELGLRASIMILQDQVYQQIPDEHKTHFEYYRLDRSKVRDDSEAKQLYFWVQDKEKAASGL